MSSGEEMDRRSFLIEGSLATLGLSALALPGRSHAMQAPAPSRDTFFESLVAWWEAGVPKWLQE